MTSKRRRNKFKEWLSDFFPPKGEIHYVANGPQRHAGPGNFMSHAQDFALHNPTMTAVQGDHNVVTYAQGDRNLVPQIMKLLSDHIILGAAHDDSARVPPPRCHPGTRINLISRITAWFNDENRHELLLWITGPAGVGKSAVVQTFAEYLVESKLLGASVFCSRPNKRNNPHRIFITIAYQLAIRIEAYREFVVERLSLDPQLLNRDMAMQFKTFIVEPFAEKKIGAGGKRWGILLDGLDELKGEDEQCEIIQLIITFIHEHPDVPLSWIIASRPESHITHTFEDNEAYRGHWSEYIPIDSTEACEDVERYLRSSFKIMQKKYRHSVPRDWPNNTDFLKITSAASGLFVYAEVVAQFIRDPDPGDPVSQLKVILSAIDRSSAVPVKDNPFIHLDALYHEILSSIPSTLWPTAKQLLGFTILGERLEFGTELTFVIVPQPFRSLRGMSILFGVTRNVLYACSSKCRSTLKIPDWKNAHKERLMFLHTSFMDYLRDSNRSKEFHVDNNEDFHVSRFYQIWNKCSGDDIATVSVESAWHQSCSKWDENSPSREIVKFHADLFNNLVSCLRRVISIVLNSPAESPVYAQLRQVHMIKLCYYFDAYDLADCVSSLFSPDIKDMRLLRKVHLGDLKFNHLDWKEMSPANAHYGKSRKLSQVFEWILRRPHSNAELKAFISELGSLQERSPDLDVVVLGGVSEGRVAVFRNPLKIDPDFHHFMYYIIPYPE